MMLKRYKIAANLAYLTTPIFLLATSSLLMAKDQSENSLPVLHYAGILPVQWDKEESWSDLITVKKSLNKDFADAVRDSHRFVALNDDLVASLWSTPAGRKELAADYELQTYAALNVSSRGDMVVMTTRLLSPVFETWLQESEVVSRSWLSEASREQNLAKLGDLIHRMINRLPVDAHITSVNGSFVTISAGSEQSINLGDEFDVLNARLQTLHPANGSWLSFSTSKTGRIKVIESKGKSSIAKVTGLIHESSLAVGHGIRIEAISGRNRFARPEGSDTFANAHSQDGNALVPAMRPDGGASASKLSPENLSLTKSDANKSIQSEIPMEQKSADAAPQDAAKSTDKESIKDGAKDSAKDAEKDTTKDSIQSSSSAVLNTIAPVGSELDTYAGLKSWAIGGSGAASAALPLWLVNSIGATIKRPLSESIVLDYGLDLGYGQTGKGSFFGYGVHGAGMYKMKLKLFDGADHIFGGLEANLHSTSVGGESSGGFDLTTLNLVAGIAGDTNSSLIGTKLDWNASLRFALQESGRFGVSGTMKKVTGGRGMLLNFLGYIGDRPKEGPQFGAGLEFGSGNYSLSDSSSATYNIISLLGLARWSL